MKLCIALLSVFAPLPLTGMANAKSEAALNLFKAISTPQEFEAYLAQIDPTTLPTTEIDQELLQYLAQKDLATYTAILTNPATTRWATLADPTTGETILHQLARRPTITSLAEKIALAITKGADKTTKNGYGNTAYAIYAGMNKKDFSILNQLDPSTSAEPGKTIPSAALKAFDAIHIADTDTPEAIAAYLDTITPGSISLTDIPTFNRLSTLNPDGFAALIMHEKGKSLATARGQQGNTLLHEIARQLNEAIDKNDTATRNALISKAALLIEQGADLAAKNKFGRTPYDLVENKPEGALLIPLTMEFEKLANALLMLKK